jgi:hypothetical protein
MAKQIILFPEDDCDPLQEKMQPQVSSASLSEGGGETGAKHKRKTGEGRGEDAGMAGSIPWWIEGYTRTHIRRHARTRTHTFMRTCASMRTGTQAFMHTRLCIGAHTQVAARLSF